LPLQDLELLCSQGGHQVPWNALALVHPRLSPSRVYHGEQLQLHLKCAFTLFEGRVALDPGPSWIPDQESTFFAYPRLRPISYGRERCRRMKGSMKKNPVILFVLGLLLLAAGGLMSLTGGPPKADPARASQCRERMKDQGPDMLAKCDESAFATAMTATDANSAAQAISAANNSEVGSNSLAMFLLGLGAVLTVAGLVTLRKRSSTGV
jgi:hypothetical protein